MKSTFASTMLLMTGLALMHAGEPTADLQAMQGTWLVSSLTELGKAIPPDDIKVLVVEITKDVLTVHEKDKIIAQYRVKLDPSKKPRTIDVTHLIGDDKGKTELGIYTLDKSGLRICLDEKKQGRPTGFTDKETQNCSVILLNRKPIKGAK